MKKQLALLLATALLSTTAYANIATYNVECNAVAGTIKITGTFEEGQAPEYISLRILKEGYEFADLVGDRTDMDKTDYINQINIEDGQRDFTFEFETQGNTRTMNGQILGQGFTKATDIKVKFVNQGEYETAVDALNPTAKSSFEDFDAVCKIPNYMKWLGFDYSISGQVNPDAVLRLLYETVKGQNNPFDRTNQSKTENMWKAASLAVWLNQNGSFSFGDYVDCLEYWNDPIQKWVSFAAQNTNAESRLKELVTGKNFDTLDKFEQCLKEALILTVVEYPDGNSNIGGVFKDFSEITNITVNNENVIYSQLAGQHFSDINGLLTAYNTLKTPNPQSSAPGFSGGGGGGGSLAFGGSVTVGNEGEGYIPNEVVNMKFVDLDTVDWAYEAISTLTDKGIISGQSETIFAPLDTITREEFVKLLVCAAGYDNKDFVSGRFTDVDENQWYAKYVNIAAENGLANGIGDGKFGIGTEISRQDMTVVIYRVLAAKGVSFNNNQLSFEDADLIADYAREAVASLSGIGAVNGIGDNMFDPMGTATRAEAAQIIFNVLAQLGGGR